MTKNEIIVLLIIIYLFENNMGINKNELIYIIIFKKIKEIFIIYF